MTQQTTSLRTAIVPSDSTTVFLAAQLSVFVEMYAKDGPESASEWANECGCMANNWNIWQPLIDAIAGSGEPENLDDLYYDDVDADPMDWL